MHLSRKFVSAGGELGDLHLHFHVVPKTAGPFPPARAAEVVPLEERARQAALVRHLWTNRTRRQRLLVSTRAPSTGILGSCPAQELVRWPAAASTAWSDAARRRRPPASIRPARTSARYTPDSDGSGATSVPRF